jgi:ketosteroid isomerase-like protein
VSIHFRINYSAKSGVYFLKVGPARTNQFQGVVYEDWPGRIGSGDLSLSLLVFGRMGARPSAANMGEDDFRKLKQNWLDAASVPDLPALRNMFSDDFMGTSFGGGVLSKHDVVPADGMTATHMPKCTLKDSTVRIFGDTAVLMGDVEMQVPQKAEDIRMTTVFQKHPEGWQIIAVHMSKAPGAS